MSLTDRNRPNKASEKGVKGILSFRSACFLMNRCLLFLVFVSTMMSVSANINVESLENHISFDNVKIGGIQLQIEEPHLWQHASKFDQQNSQNVLIENDEEDEISFLKRNTVKKYYFDFSMTLTSNLEQKDACVKISHTNLKLKRKHTELYLQNKVFRI